MTMRKSTANGDAEIRKVIEDQVAALRAKDAARVVAGYPPGFIQFSLAPPLISTASDAAGLDASFGTWEGPLGYEIRDLAVTTGDEVAFCHALIRLSGTKTDGSKPAVWFRLTLGLKKIDGAWKIAHEHESVPFYMDGSLRAAVDLEP
jgi:ketosteroid isomerase-like protein